MANELQIRLTADIAQLQSALTKAKNTIKSFESETEKESEKGNVGFRRKIGLIEQLTNKAKALRTSLSQATNEQQIERYNQELEQTTRELTRLNALGRSVTANLGSTAGGFGQVARQGANANGVAIEFNRVIQDAPFGLIGIGNNLQQLAGNFQQVAKQAGGTGAAIKASLASIISPVNLGLLAVSALTAGFTAYQMGAFDSLFATEDLGKSVEEAAQKLEDYRNSLDAVTRASIEGTNQGQKEVQNFQLLRAQAENANIPLKTRIEAVKELQSTFPQYLGNLTQEQILTGNVGNAYESLTEQIIATAKARAFSDRIAENQLQRFTLEERAANRVNDILKARDEFTKAGESIYDVGEIEIIKQIKDLTEEQLNDVNEINRLKEEEEKLTGKINEQISQGAKFTEAEVKAVKQLNDAYDENIAKVEFSTNLKNQSAKTFEELARGLSVGGTSPIVDLPINVNIIPENAEIDDSKLTEFVLRLKEFNDQIAGVLEEGAERSLGDFAFAIGDALGKGTNVLEASGSALLGSLASILNQLGQLAIGTGIAIAGIKKALQTLNPAAAIGAGVALIALAGFVSAKARALGGFGGGSNVGGGGFSGGSASASSGAPPQIFTNSQIPRPPGSSAPTPTGNIDFGNAQGRLEARIDGNDIVFVYDRTKERQQGGG